MYLLYKYRDQDWFEFASNYVFSRFEAIEIRFIETTRYVEIHTDNRLTFSYEYASILRDCGSTFGSLLDAIIKGAKIVKSETNTNIADYRKLLHEQINEIDRMSIQIRLSYQKDNIPI